MLPTRFTECERYRGHIIAMRAAVYTIFTAKGVRVRTPDGQYYRRDTRAQCRNSLDALLDRGEVA